MPKIIKDETLTTEDARISSTQRDRTPRGRGTGLQPLGRFERLEVEPDDDAPLEDHRPTEVYLDTSRSVLTSNESPDVGFDWSLNPYRGCEHGCSYCYARPYHEYLGWSAGLDFETKILAKTDAPRLLEDVLCRPDWEPSPIAFSGVTDAYQPIERRLRITRQCLEVLERLGHPAMVVTKNALVTRDIDLLGSLARRGASSVGISVTTLSSELAGALEPRASSPRQRLEAIRQLSAAGIPVGVFVAPVIPALTDHELPNILKAAAEAGASWAVYLMLRLPGNVEEIFIDWLGRQEPHRLAKVLGRQRELRGGALSDTRFGKRMRGEGPWASQLDQIYRIWCRRLDLRTTGPVLSTESFRRPREQLELFDT